MSEVKLIKIKSKEAVANNPHPINFDHQKAIEASLGEGKKLKCLFHFENR